MDLPFKASRSRPAESAAPDTSARPLALAAILGLLCSGTAGSIALAAWWDYAWVAFGSHPSARLTLGLVVLGALAAGLRWGESMAHRSPRPLAAFAWSQISLGAIAIGYPLVQAAVLLCVTGLSRAFGAGSSVILNGLGAVFALGAPCILLGVTPPLLNRAAHSATASERSEPNPRLAPWLIGGAAGAPIAWLACIPDIGLESTLLVAASLQLATGGAALALSTRWRELEGSLGRGQQQATLPAALPPPSRETQLLLWIVGLTGLLGALLFLVWAQLATLAFGPTSSTIPWILSTTAAGLAAGAWSTARVRFRHPPFSDLGWTLLALSGTLLALWGAAASLPGMADALYRLIAREAANTFTLRQALQALGSLCLVGLPAACLGRTLPLAVRFLQPQGGALGRTTGRLLALQFGGAAIGLVLASQLLPRVGLARTHAACVALAVVLGIACLQRRHVLAQPLPASLLAFATLAFAVLMGGATAESWRRLSLAAPWDAPSTRPRAGGSSAPDAPLEIAFHREGLLETVCVASKATAAGQLLTLRVNGQVEATTASGFGAHVLLAHIPALLHPHPTNGLVVGLEAGFTAGALLQHTNLLRLDLLEPSRDIVEASRLFDPVNHGPLGNPRSRLLAEDPRGFLRRTPERYDLILCPAGRPCVTRHMSLFSREFYEACRDRLRPEGLLAQRLEFRAQDPAVTDLVLNTFVAVFPHVSLWAASENDLLLVGSSQPLATDLATLRQRFATQEVRADLARLDLLRLPVLLAHELVPADQTVHLLPPGGRLHSDVYPAFDRIDPRPPARALASHRLAPFDQTRSPRPASRLGQHLATHPLTAADCRAFALFGLSQRTFDPQLQHSILLRWIQLQPDSLEPAEHLFRLAASGPSSALEAARWEPLHQQILAGDAQQLPRLRAYVTVLLETHRASRSAFIVPSTTRLNSALERLAELDPSQHRLTRLLLAEVAWDHGDDDACFRWSAEGLRPLAPGESPPDLSLDTAAPARVMTRLLETLHRTGRTEEATEICRQAVQSGYVNPEKSGRHPELEMACRRALANGLKQSATPPQRR